MAVPAPNLNTTLDKSKLSAVAAKYSPDIIQQRIKTAEFNQHFLVDRDISNSRRYPKVVVDGKIRPYDGQVKANGSVTLSDRELVVKVGSKEMNIDPEFFRYTWASEMENLTEGNRIPLEVYILKQFIDKALADLDDETVYLGDIAANPASTSSAILVCDGLNKIFADLTTSGILVPISTPAHTEGTGWNDGFTDGNVIDNVKKVWKGFTPTLRKEQITIFCSYDVYEMYGNNYRRRHNKEAKYDKTILDAEFITIDGTRGKARLMPASWLGTSSRLIGTVNGAIRVGTDVPNMISSIKVQEVGYNFVFLMKVAFGIQVIDTDGLRINTLA